MKWLKKSFAQLEKQKRTEWNMKSASVWDHVDVGIKFKGLLRIKLSIGSEKGSI